MAISKFKKEKPTPPMLQVEFAKASLYAVTITDRRKFESLLRRYNVIQNGNNVYNVTIGSPLNLPPYGVTSGMTGEIRMLELAANGTNYVGFKSPNSVMGDHVWVLPGSDGVNGQPLVTDGNHNLIWGDSNCYWIKDGDDIYYADGKVKILTLSDSEVDPVMQYGVGASGTIKWTMGADDSDANMFKIASGSALGTNDCLKLTEAGTTYAKECLVSLGYGAMASITTGWRNTAIGYYAQNALTTGFQNIAIGWNAQGAYPVAGRDCIAIGTQAQYNLVGGEYDVAIGIQAQRNVTNGSSNVSVGFGSLEALTTANYNTAIGDHALAGTDASYATAIGAFAGQTKTTEAGGIFVGYYAGTGETDANRVWIDGLERVGTLTQRRALAFMYGVMAAAVADQYLYLNSNVSTPRPFTSTLADGTAPFVLTSTTVSTNLNADLLDGQHAAAFLTSVTAHDILSATHGDSTAAAVVRGDIIIGSGATPKWTRLAKGTENYVLTAGANEPAWAAPSAGATTFVALTDTPANYSGAGGYFVKVNAGADALEFVASSVAAHDILSAAHGDSTAGSAVAGDVIYADNTPKWTKLAHGSDGDVLTLASGLPSWAAPGGASHAMLSATHTDSTASAVSRGSIIIGDSTPKWVELPVGANTYVLTSNGTDVAWAAPSGGGAPTAAKYIVQEAHADLSAEQSLGALATGIMLNTTTAGVGVLSVATWVDMPDAEVIRMHEQVAAPDAVASHSQIYIEQVVSATIALLHFEGADESTTFTDESGKTWTASGGAKIDTAQYKFGSASGYFDGNGDYVTCPDHADFNMGTGDCTIDFWVYPEGVQAANYPSIICSSASWVAGTFAIRYDNNGMDKKFGVFWNPSDPFITGSTVHEPNHWYHVAVTRSGTEMKLYVNGVCEGAAECSTTALDLSTSICRLGWGEWDGANGYFKGWVDDLRITKGAVLWSFNFTPPAHAPALTNPMLRYKDGSGNVRTIAD